MSSFFQFARPSQEAGTAFGVKINSPQGIPTELDQVKGNIMKASKKYREELSKYRELAAFNAQLSKGYLKNLEAMVDVSKVLNQYVEIFNVLKTEFEENDKLFGTSLTSNDLSYLEQLTKSKMDTLNNKFKEETDKLKVLYTAYGRKDEMERVLEAEKSLQLTMENADKTFDSLKVQVPPPVEVKQGGAKKTQPIQRRRGQQATRMSQLLQKASTNYLRPERVEASNDSNTRKEETRKETQKRRDTDVKCTGCGCKRCKCRRISKQSGPR